MKVSKIISLLTATILAMTVTMRTANSADIPLLNAMQNDIFRIVEHKNGYITKEMHDDFWSQIPEEKIKTPQIRQGTILDLNATLLMGYSLKKEALESTRASMKAGKIIHTPGYKEARRDYLTLGKLPQNKQLIDDLLASNDAMIKAGATGSPFQSPKGPIPITAELLDTVQQGINGQVARIKLLISPDWNPHISETRYPQAHIAIRSIVPFNVLVRGRSSAERGPVMSVLFENAIDENRNVVVSYVNLGTPLGNPENDMAQLVAAIAQATNSKFLAPISHETWRGMSSAKGDIQSTHTGGSSFMSVRIVNLPQYTGYLILRVGSTISLPDSSLTLHSLEESLQIID
ncbi:hypothetical protein [Insolitispirillum peregrinum]|uniref:hypothetical protein n=1 Tax=Insolitispirillum peregrinum TaxID=80876 RepID=UPI003614124E